MQFASTAALRHFENPTNTADRLAAHQLPLFSGDPRPPVSLVGRSHPRSERLAQDCSSAKTRSPRGYSSTREYVMSGLSSKTTFGKRRVTRVSNFARPAPIPVVTVSKRIKRLSEREARWCVCYAHMIEFDQEVVREAILLDVSELGARFRCRSRASFPENLRLRVPRLGLDLQARTVWQKGFDTGIAFED